MSVERAEVDATVPKRAALEKWTREKAQEWARNEVLAGGPPDDPIAVATGEKVKWDNVRDYVGKKLKIRAKPMGLIVTLPDGTRRFFAGDATRGSGKASGKFGSGDTHAMRDDAAVEQQIRTFVEAEVKRYNKALMKAARERGDSASRAFWECGRRIREFVRTTPGVNQDRVWYALGQWGKGADGYGKNWVEYATYFYDWRPSPEPSDRVFELSETRVMLIIRAADATEERQRLVEASLDNGPYGELSDTLFKWAMGLSKNTFAGPPSTWEALAIIKKKVTSGAELTPAELERARGLAKELKAARVQVAASDEAI